MTGPHARTFTPPGDWFDAGLCAQTDPEAFFPERGESSRDAKEMCRRCPVVAECLAWALTRDDYGVWGGLTRNQRTRLKKRTTQEGPAA